MTCSSTPRRALAILLLAAGAAVTPLASGAAQERPSAERAGGEKPSQDLARVVAGQQRRAGLLDLYVDVRAGKVRLRLPPPGADGVMGRYLYQASLASGLGSTPVGLDRAEMARTQVVAFRRVGRRVILQAENHGFRADGGTPEEQRAVRDSFAVSNLWSGEVEAEAADGAVLVDFSSFLGQDALDIAARLKQRRQGTFRLSAPLSYIDAAGAAAFPENVELEAVQTFTSEEPGPEVRGVAPDPRNLTFTVHHSFLKLPDPGFTPRLHDPRTGTSVQVLVNNYGADLTEPVVYRLVRRFRLEKTDPTAARSRVKKPIVFYVDRAAPEPIRSALVEGAGWWAQAFEAAGFIDAFRVEVLPEGVSPMDARYNVINWIHRQTRGWSTGQTVVDPRTGEIVRGVVQLGSLRVRQDRMIFEGLVGADRTGAGGPDDPVQLALWRIRQLSMHETGHALGFAHNFAGSTYGDRASAMDYPGPLVRVKGDRLDLSRAYRTGAGDWDKFTVKWLYSQFPPGVDERRELDRLAQEAVARGYRFITDTEHPASTQWDNGDDPVAELDNVMRVRRIALDRFGLQNIPKGAPVADLRRVFVPIYLFHRYQLDAAVKQIGGVDYAYAVRGDGQERARPVPASAQRRALAALLRTLDPEALDLPDRTVELLSAAQSGSTDRQFEIELFRTSGGPVFDLPGVATTASDLTLSPLLDAERLNRVVEQHRRDPGQLSLPELLSGVFDALAPQAGKELPPRLAEIRRRQRVRLAGDAADTLFDPKLSPTAAAELRTALTRFGGQLRDYRGSPEELNAAQYLAAILLDADPDRLKALTADRLPSSPAPPGSPIGEGCWFCAPPTAADR
ncbi:zinc-dependent metalloprotease [Phenylobacterium sp.]|uniref:zinc-dependent metalloprotease n=1 Tax=Phenylobacterium sp. TaxID=1871053 RepID=UPI00391CCCF2